MTALIERVSAEHESSVTASGRHRIPDGHQAAHITQDVPAPKRSLLTRRLAPIASGAAVALIAATVVTVAQSSDDTTIAAPELSNSISNSQPAPAAAPTEVPPTSETAAPTSTPPTTEAAKKEEAAPKKEAKAAAPKAAGGSGGGGRTAAAAHGWKQVGGDEFNGSTISGEWTQYNGAGHAGNGRRTSEALSLQGGSLVISGDANGNTGGMAWKADQKYGKWEMRAKFPKGSPAYHPVLILWPESGDGGNGETDFAETDSASDKVSFFLHHGDDQEWAHKKLDITQWHNYAVEWTSGRMTGYIDGVKWFEATDPSVLPKMALHPTIQLDYFPEDGKATPTKMFVDYMRIYR